MLLDIYKSDKDIGVLGCNLLTRDKLPNHSFAKKNMSIKFLKHENSLISIIKRRILGKNINSYNFSNENIEVGYICGAALFISKNLFDKIGGFDENIFMYSEDDELCFFAKKQGKKILNTPKTSIIHLEGGSFKNTPFNENKTKHFLDGGFNFFISCYDFKTACKYLKTQKRINRWKIFISIFSKQKLMYYRCERKVIVNKLKNVKLKYGGNNE